MSKSLKRVKSALLSADPTLEVIEISQATTAKAAAESLGCAVDQIAKSILFEGHLSGQLYLFVTAGARQVDLEQAVLLTDEPLSKTDAARIRAVTGFAIGGVSPVGHLTEIVTFFDETLFDYQKIYAAAGTPVHVFGCAPQQMADLCQGRISAFSQKM
ncbi:MAG: YbaK/EbsC family protein [Planktomarina sp.]|uniref:YbaK/EbsC family protein n=1 Tax=Planktomarina sp. TaxID=2024851 RepID=UPI003C6711D0